MQNQPVLVVAAAGKTSAEVVKQLQARNVSVRVLVRSADKAKQMFGEDIEIFDGFDYDQLTTATVALSGVRKVYLVSSPAVNAFEQTTALIDAASSAGGRRFVSFPSPQAFEMEETVSFAVKSIP